MKRLLERFRPSVWLAPGGYWALAVLALLFGLGAIAAPFAWVAAASSVLFLFALIYDAFALPPPSRLIVGRAIAEPFALRRSAQLTYRVANHSARILRIGLFEAPARLLQWDRDEASAIVGPHARTVVIRTVNPVARGSESLETIFGYYEGAPGLLRRTFRVRHMQTIRVYPDLSAVERFGALRVRNRLIEAGLQRMRLRGAGTELESLREWVPGDPFRSIDWKATARRGRLMAAQYEVERSQNIMVVLDAGRLMMPRVDEQRKFDYAITAALSVASIAALVNDKVGVLAFAGSVLRATAPRSSGRSLARITETLADLEPLFEESDYAGAFAYVRTHLRKRSLIVFFTDMIDPTAQSAVLSEISSLAKRHVVVCAFMNDAAIERALDAAPRSSSQAYAAAVALELQDERRVAVALLERLGIVVVDVPARRLTTALIDRYLHVKQRGML